MEEPKSITFSQIVVEVFKNGNSNPEFLKVLNIFQNDSSNFTKCKEIIENDSNDIYMRIFASQTILNLTRLYISSWKIDFAINLCDWSISYILTNCKWLEKIIFSSLSDLVALILQYYWIFNNAECMNIWNEIIQIFDDGPDEWIPALFLITSIHDKLCDSKDKKVVDLFSKNCLPTSFILAYNCAKRIRNSTLPNLETILDMSLNLIMKCIYNRINESEFRGITYEDQISFYFELYNSFQVLPALKCLYAIADSIYILNFSNKPKIIEQICCGFMNILREKFNIIDNDQLNYILTIISQIASYLRYSQIQQMTEPKNINEFIMLMANLTNSVIQQKRSLTTITNTISFWTKIESALRNDGNVQPKKLITDLAPELCVNYINYLLELQNFNLKSESPQSQQKSNDIFEILEGKISQYVFPIKNFVMLNPDKICPQLLNGLVEKQKELKASFENLADVLQSELTLSFFVEIAIVVVLIKTSGINQDPKIRYHSDFFIQIISLLKDSEKWAANNIFFPHLEMCLILFIAQFKNTLFGSQSQVSRNLYLQLKKRSSISSIEGCQTFLIDRTITTLRFFNESNLISQALSIIHNSKNTPSKKTLDMMFAAPFDQSFPFISIFENKHLRSHFFSTIFSIIIKMIQSNNFSYFNILLTMLDNRFNLTSAENITESDEIKKEICFLAIDICGIFNEAKENVSFNPLFEWFISNNKSSVFEIAFKNLLSANEDNNNNDAPDNNTELKNDETINSILKMWKSIVLCTPPKRIVFGPSSANGIILFKAAANFLINYCKYIQSFPSIENLSIYKIKGIKYIFLILQNLVSGMYVPFYALKIYNDPIFLDLLNELNRIISEPMLKLIVQYTPAFKAMIHLFRDLMVNQIEILLETTHSLIITILNCSINSLTNHDKEVEQCIFDIILSFLQYFYECALDYKPFQNQLEIINLILWDKVLNGKTVISTCIVDLLRYLYLLNNQSLAAIIEKTKPSLPSHKKKVVEDMFLNLQTFFSENDLQIININDIMKCIDNIVDAVNQSTPVVFV